MDDVPLRARPSAIHALPSLLTRAPAWLLLTIGLTLVALGLLIVTRPLTSLWLLGVYVGISCLIAGIAEFSSGRETPNWWNSLFAVVWILAGFAILLWLGYSIQLLPTALAILLVVAGVSSLGGIARGRVSERVLTAAWGVAQLVFGILALAWPDATLLVVAVLFGIRTIVFGASLLWRAGRGFTGNASTAATGALGRSGWSDLARWTAAVAVLALAASSWWISSTLRAGAPVIDAFYDVPTEIAEEPGVLVRVGEYGGEQPEGGTARRILYTTTDTHGDPAVASALVIAPSASATGPAPVLVWNHGTTGIARGCAPSLMANAATDESIPDIDAVLEQGWVVVATDYSGQGAPGVFPYLIGEGQGRSALDGVRAARQLDDLDLSDDVVIWGHSQGGHAALWTSAIAAQYAPDVNVVGTVAMSPAAIPLGMAALLNDPDPSALLSVAVSWVLVPYSQTYDDVEFSDYVTTSGRTIVLEASQRCATEPGLLVSVLAALGVSQDRPLYTGDLTQGVIGDRLAQNETVGPFPAPLLVAWGDADQVISPALQHEYVQKLCDAEVFFEWAEYSGYDHAGVIRQGSPFLDPLIDWTAARFAGESADPASC